MASLLAGITPGGIGGPRRLTPPLNLSGASDAATAVTAENTFGFEALATASPNPQTLYEPIVAVPSSWGGIASVASGQDNEAVASSSRIFVSDTTSPNLYTSVSGTKWNAQRLPAEFLATTGTLVAHGPGAEFVAIGTASTNSVSARTTNGINWVTTGSLPAKTWRLLAYGGGLYCAIASDGSTAYSSDGVTWTAGTATNTATVTSNTDLIYWRGAFYFFYSTSLDEGSPNGTWTARSSTSGGANPRAARTSLTGRLYVSRDNAGSGRYSDDGVNWFTPGSDIAVDANAYGNGYFVTRSGTGAVGYMPAANAAFGSGRIQVPAAPSSSYGPSAYFNGAYIFADSTNRRISIHPFSAATAYPDLSGRLQSDFISATTAVSTATATLFSPGIDLAADIAAVADTTAALSTSIRLAAAPAAVADTTAALSTSIFLAATPAAIASTTAALTTAPSGFAASIAAVASTTAALSTSIRLAAAPAAVASTTAAISTSIRLAADIAAVASITAALSTSIRLAATPAAVASTTAALSTSIRLAAATTAIASTTAAVSTSIRLAAATTAVASTTAALSTSIQLAATLAAVASTTAALTTVSGGLSAFINAIASVTAAVSTSIRLAAAPAAVASTTAALSTEIQLIAACSATATISAGLQLNISSGNVEVLSASSAQAVGNIQLSAAGAATSTSAAVLRWIPASAIAEIWQAQTAPAETWQAQTAPAETWQAQTAPAETWQPQTVPVSGWSAAA